MTSRKTSPLPPMPFGAAVASASDDIRAFQDTVLHVLPSLREYAPAGYATDFEVEFAQVDIGSLSLVASVSSPVHFDVAQTDEIYLMIPMSGTVTTRAGSKRYVGGAGVGAMLAPRMARHGTTTALSMVQTHLDSNRLKRTAYSMLGYSLDTRIDDVLSEHRILPLQKDGFRLDAGFSGLFSAIHHYGSQAHAMKMMGLDDVFYRHVIALFFPDILLGAGNAQTARDANRPLDRVCDYITAHLSDPLYLSELEHIAGMSARALQYAFLKRFGCSPMHWIRQQRLELARQRLIDPADQVSVTQIAFSCGFTQLGIFARLYRQRFGETPSATLDQTFGR